MTRLAANLLGAARIHRATMRSYALAWRWSDLPPVASARAIARAVRARDYAMKCAEVAKEAA